MKDLVNQTLGAHVVYVEPLGRKARHRDWKLEAIFPVPFVLDTVIHEGHKTSSDDNTGRAVSMPSGTPILDCTHSATSFVPFKTFASLTQSELGGIHPPLRSSSNASAGVIGTGTMCATGCALAVSYK